MEKPALIFDLDGTLWDASSPVATIWTEKGKEKFGSGFSLSPSDVRGLMGKTMAQILLEIAPSMSEKERAEFSQTFLKAEIEYLKTHPGKLFPGELETLQKLTSEGYRLFIVSNCQWGYIENFLPLVPKEFFLDHLCWSDTKQDKHVTIEALMAKNHLANAIYIGDTRGDEVQTRLARLPFIFAAYGYGEAVAPDSSLANFSSLPGAVSYIEKHIIGK